MGGHGRQEQLALGDTPNIAARIQGLAAPDTVLISAATHRLVQGYFAVTTLGPQMLKGVTAPVPVYHILGVSSAQSRLDVVATTGLTPLVGRESEVALLMERWKQSKAGLGQVVLLSGEGALANPAWWRHYGSGCSSRARRASCFAVPLITLTVPCIR
jgi:Adenylate and Guanylate cyclase catalytic domain